MKLTFLGANRQVTGSRYALHVGDRRVMIDDAERARMQFKGLNYSELLRIDDAITVRCLNSPG